MRIAIASCGLGHVARGIEAWAADLAAALHARGEAVALYKGGGEATLGYDTVLPCWRRDRSPVNHTWFPKRMAWRFGYGSPYMAEQTTFAKSLIATLKRAPADILHVQDPHVALRVQEAGLKTRVILAHGTEEPDAFLNRIRFVQHLAPWHLEQAKARGCWKPEWTAIPNFIDTDKYAPGPATLRDELGIPRGAKVILTAAAIKRHHKRIDHLLRECAPVPEVHVIVAGGREAETASVIAEGKNLLGDRVRFLVSFPRERMADLYRSADVFVLPSLFEMMPIALLEASASGSPCVTHEHPVMRWMTGPGGVGIDMSEPEALAAMLNADLAALGSAARAHCVAHFGTAAVVDRILAYYRQVLSSG